MHIAASNPMVIDKKDIKEDVIEKEKIIEEELKNLGNLKKLLTRLVLVKLISLKRIIVCSLKTGLWIPN